MPIARLTVDNTALLIIDLQERLLPVIADQQRVVARAATLIDGCAALGVPMVQYPLVVLIVQRVLVVIEPDFGFFGRHGIASSMVAADGDPTSSTRRKPPFIPPLPAPVVRRRRDGG